MLSFRPHLARSLGIPVLTVFLTLSFSQASAEPSNLRPYDNNPVLAVVEGEPIILDDLKTQEIHGVMVQLHQMQELALKEKILEKLSGKHPEMKLSQIPVPDRDDITRFYQSTPAVKELGTLEKMEGEIQEYLKKMFRTSYIEDRYQMAIKKGWAKVYLQPPLEFKLRAEIKTAKLWFEGDDGRSRRIFLLEYSDFQCPFCKRVQGTLDRLRKKYGKEVQFGYRHFPLDFHKGAKFLAESVECARDQDRFWEFQKILYEHSSTIERTNIYPYAKKAGVMNLRQFRTCVQERKYKNRVLNDFRDGIKLGIRGTPTFILGTFDPDTRTVSGDFMSGAVSEEKFSQVIEKYLSISRAEARLPR